MDMTYTSPSYYQGLVPTSGTMNLSFKNYEQIAATDYHERMTELHAEKDLVYLGEIPATQLNFFIYMGEDVSSLDDLKGKRIRVFPTLLPLVKALGAEPIVMSMGEIYTAMERGTIDGFMQGPLGQAKQFGNLVKTVVAPGVYRAGFPVLVNAKTWAEMSPDLQKRLTTFLREDFAPRQDSIWAKPIADSQAEMKAKGWKFLELTGAGRSQVREDGDGCRLGSHRGAGRRGNLRRAARDAGPVGPSQRNMPVGARVRPGADSFQPGIFHAEGPRSGADIVQPHQPDLRDRRCRTAVRHRGDRLFRGPGPGPGCPVRSSG